MIPDAKQMVLRLLGLMWYRPSARSIFHVLMCDPFSTPELVPLCPQTFLQLSNSPPRDHVLSVGTVVHPTLDSSFPESLSRISFSVNTFTSIHRQEDERDNGSLVSPGLVYRFMSEFELPRAVGRVVSFSRVLPGLAPHSRSQTRQALLGYRLEESIPAFFCLLVPCLFHLVPRALFNAYCSSVPFPASFTLPELGFILFTAEECSGATFFRPAVGLLFDTVVFRLFVAAHFLTPSRSAVLFLASLAQAYERSIPSRLDAPYPF